MLKDFKVYPKTIWLDRSMNRSAKGYEREWFTHLYACYPAPYRHSNRHTVTTRVNTGRNATFKPSHGFRCDGWKMRKTRVNTAL